MPLILQENYKPDGWLGIIMGARMFVNFTKYSFDECIKRLQHEISEAGFGDIKKVNENHKKSIESAAKSIEAWKLSDTQSWLNRTNMNENIKATLKDFDGKMLHNLNSIRLAAPDYFFNAISKNNTIDLFSVVKFNEEFKSLFE